MADLKISALTASTTPLAGTEVLPIVQSGTTKQVSVANLTAGRSVAGSNFIPSGSSVPTNGMYLPATNTVAIATNSAEAINVDPSGDILLGTSTMANGRIRLQIKTGVSDLGIAIKALNDGNFAAGFYNSANSLVGSIVINSATTSYNVASDYRLKNSIVPMTGALAKVLALKPVTYNWNADGSDGEGFIAHELAEVCPNAVTGEKDAVDDAGNPKYQGIDTSFLVATLTAAIQELKAEFDAYKAAHP
jgi:hypothetical protein